MNTKLLYSYRYGRPFGYWSWLLSQGQDINYKMGSADGYVYCNPRPSASTMNIAALAECSANSYDRYAQACCTSSSFKDSQIEEHVKNCGHYRAKTLSVEHELVKVKFERDRYKESWQAARELEKAAKADVKYWKNINCENINSWQKAYDKVHERADKAEVRVKDLEQRVGELQNSECHWKSRVAELKKQIEQSLWYTKYQKAQASVDNLRCTNNRLEARIKELDANLKEIKDDFLVMDREFHDRGVRIAKLEQLCAIAYSKGEDENWWGVLRALKLAGASKDFEVPA